MTQLILKDECYRVVGACFEVYNKMGPGFLEAVYQECLAIELAERGVPSTPQPSLVLRYKQHTLTKKYQPDFICFNQIVVEIKAKKALDDIDRAQVINYLKATQKPLGLLVNFCGSSDLEYLRLINHNR